MMEEGERSAMNIEEIVIIGAGPAGIAAAIQLKRYGLDPLIIEKNLIGGLLVNANLVENYPGFPKGIPGPELVELLNNHLTSLDLRILQGTVIRVGYEKDHFAIASDRGEFTSRIVVLATGTVPIVPEIPIRYKCGSRIFFEVHPIVGQKDRTIAIVGGGDAAFDYALNLAKGNDVIILNRSDRLACLPLLKKRADIEPRIQYRDHTNIVEIDLDEDHLRLTIQQHPPNNINNSNTSTNNTQTSTNQASESTLTVDHLVFAIGREPEIDILDPRLVSKQEELIEEGLLYLIGDLKNGRYRQTVIAMSDGVKAAMSIAEILPERPG